MTKTKERQRKVTSQAKHKLHTEISKKAPPEQMQAPPEHAVTSQAKHKLHTEISKKAPSEQMQAPPEHADANFQILAHLF
jgi:hypothetical protein